MKLFLFIFPLLCISCATSTYHLEISPRYDLIGENIFNDDVYNSYNEYNVTNSGLKGFGGQIAITETTRYTFARIGYYESSLKSDRFTYSTRDSESRTEEVSLFARGIESQVGFNIWHFKPYVSASYSHYTFRNPPEEEPSAPSNAGTLGFGLAIDIPLSESVDILINNNFINGNQSHSLGLMFRLGTIHGWDSKERDK